jgi:hypothetical protein
MYHGIVQSKIDSATNVDLFQKEMKYIYDNKFKVITISQLGYDAKHNYLYIKDLGSETEMLPTNVTTPIEAPTTTTTNVTTPIEAPTTTTTNVTTPTVMPGGNIILEILKKLFGLEENIVTTH